MDSINDFLKVDYGSGSSNGSGDGSGYGNGFGDDSGYGNGFGFGDGSGSSNGFGFGDGSGYGSGSGDGSGYGNGSGYGYDSGYGNGFGFGDGSGYDISKFNGETVYRFDGIPTIIRKIKGNVATGFILEPNLTLKHCYVVKGRDLFAHGRTLREAMDELENKIFSTMDTDDVIDSFLKEFSDLDKKYYGREFYIWHNRLTGSCKMGRDTFVANGGYDLDNDMFTVHEFINITRNAYGGQIIRQLEERLQEVDK